MKIFIVIITFLCCWFSLAIAQVSDSTGVLRIQVDTDEVSLLINGENVITDSYGNSLLKQATFLLNLTPGDYKLIFSSKDFEPIDTAITLIIGEVISLDINFIPDTSSIELPVELEINISSQPDSINIIVYHNSDTLTTPVSISYQPRTLSFRAYLEGYETLSADYVLSDTSSTSLEFLLKTKKPERLTNLDLDLEYRPILLPRNKMEAKVLRSKFNSFAEMFAIFPLSQGILAKIILDSDNDSDADILILSGAVLSIGSYILGKILYKKRLNYILFYNEKIKIDNQLAKQFNASINDTLSILNKTASDHWEIENKEKGMLRTANK